MIVDCEIQQLLRNLIHYPDLCKKDYKFTHYAN